MITGRKAVQSIRQEGDLTCTVTMVKVIHAELDESPRAIACDTGTKVSQLGARSARGKQGTWQADVAQEWTTRLAINASTSSRPGSINRFHESGFSGVSDDDSMTVPKRDKARETKIAVGAAH